LTIENISCGEVNVVYAADKKRTYNLPKTRQIGINGCLELFLADGAISVKPLADSKITLYYSIGERFVIQPGDKIYRGSKLLIEYKDDNWADSDW